MFGHHLWFPQNRPPGVHGSLVVTFRCCARLPRSPGANKWQRHKNARISAFNVMDSATLAAEGLKNNTDLMWKTSQWRERCCFILPTALEANGAKEPWREKFSFKAPFQGVRPKAWFTAGERDVKQSQCRGWFSDLVPRGTCMFYVYVFFSCFHPLFCHCPKCPFQKKPQK